ncbi:hypothetical protein L1987_83240 [Smallanthus sonchifolius]|uniref:Uncharacterized protein n=1 Tax=Smallanthus sonchifolius TaxID=185202 RepID=A0ACB8YCC3_9ASTR|nr:hypothetical protein L1987_83240 [Smallanthus sonchifolius]
MFLSFLFLWFSVLIFTATAAEFRTHYCDINTTSHINNTSFYSNLVQVLDSLALDYNTINDKRFLNESTGSIQPDIAYGLYLCRADVLPSDCLNCLLNAREDINKTCPFSKAAVSWSDNCMLRYANYSIASVMNSNTFIPECNKVNISDVLSEQSKFWQDVMSFMGELANRASNDLKGMLAYAELSYNSEKIYGYVECTPDLSSSACHQCLQVSIDRLPLYCFGKRGARVLAASCNVRFEIYKFLQFSTASSSAKPGIKINFIML